MSIIKSRGCRVFFSDSAFLTFSDARPLRGARAHAQYRDAMGGPRGVIRPGINFATRDSLDRASPPPGDVVPARTPSRKRARDDGGSAAAVVPLRDDAPGRAAPNAEGETRTKKGKKDKKDKKDKKERF